MIHPDAAGLALLAAAGLVGAAVNAVAGGGTLVSFPVLLALGASPLSANVTSTVGLVTGYAGGSAAYRDLLHDQWRRTVVLGAVSAAGAGAGVVLLLRVASGAFQRVVPWLILLSCVLLAGQPVLTRLLERRARRGRELQSPGLLLGEFAAAVYGAFFGAGLGVLTLAVLGLFLRDDLQRLNALKGVLSLVINVVAAVSFVFLAPVAWTAVWVMLPAGLAGGFLGVGLARRLPAAALRGVVVALGVAVAVRLLV